ncbi:MAG: diacylglycerol kinase family protein [Planctomycetes bacterium]|nr:diacylglycerol kinase family protein [Planctomycetota bacterium]
MNQSSQIDEVNETAQPARRDSGEVPLVEDLPRHRSWWVRKFGPAFTGLTFAFKTQSSLWIHAFCGAGVIVGGFYFRIEPLEFLVLIVLIGLVIALELLNTAIEHAVKVNVKEWNPYAKHALDVMAGAVLWVALVASVVALIIFGPRILDKFGT